MVFICEKYMKKAIQLAQLGRGHTNPNPMVGAVIVKNNKIIGGGYHQYYGGLHAERDSFANCTEVERRGIVLPNPFNMRSIFDM